MKFNYDDSKDERCKKEKQISLRFHPETVWMHAYLRNCKSKKKKHLRCFPSCCKGGHKTTFCGQSIRAIFRLPNENIKPVSFLAIGCFAVDENIIFRTGEMIQLRIGPPGYCSALGYSLPFYYGSEIPSSSIGSLEFMFNKKLDGWHYGYKGSKATQDYYHVFRVFLIMRLHAKDNTFRIVDSIASPPWQMYCRRRKHTRHALHERIERPLEFSKSMMGERQKRVPREGIHNGRKQLVKSFRNKISRTPSMTDVVTKKRQSPSRISEASAQAFENYSEIKRCKYCLTQLLGKLCIPNPLNERIVDCQMPATFINGRTYVRGLLKNLLRLAEADIPTCEYFLSKTDKRNIQPFMPLKIRKYFADFLLAKIAFRKNLIKLIQMNSQMWSFLRSFSELVMAEYSGFQNSIVHFNPQRIEKESLQDHNANLRTCVAEAKPAYNQKNQPSDHTLEIVDVSVIESPEALEKTSKVPEIWNSIQFVENDEESLAAMARKVYNNNLDMQFCIENLEFISDHMFESNGDYMLHKTLDFELFSSLGIEEDMDNCMPRRIEGHAANTATTHLDLEVASIRSAV